MMKKGNKAKYAIVSVSLCVAMLFGGCGAGTGEEVLSDNIELIEPVGSVAEYEEALYRNLYDVTVYSATVFPYVVEYGFSSDQKFNGYGALPGEKVKKNEILVYSDSESIDKQIEAMEEKIENMVEEYETYKNDLIEEWYETKHTLSYYGTIVDNCINLEPDPYEPPADVSGGDAGTGTTQDGEQGTDDTAFDGSTTETEDETLTYEAWLKAYEEWEKLYHYWEGQYRILAHSIDTQEKELEKKTKLYDLDYAHALKQLERLKEQKKDGSVISGMNGEIVAITDLTYGDKVSKDKSLVAVGSAETKVLKTEYISVANMSKVKEIYAMIDGKKYEVEHEAMDSETYLELSSKGETIYSTFHFVGECGDVNVGDFAVIVLVKERKENVLSVPKEAIHKDESGRYVYVLENEESVYTYVEVGMSDGAYTEITSGLTEGQKVLMTGVKQPGSNVATVEMGSFNNTFTKSGYMYYPSNRLVQNPIEYGTVYFQEMKVSQYQHVEKGDVIATVRVQMDEMALQRQENQLKRLEERYQDWLDGYKDSDEGPDEELLASKQEQIADVKEQIADMKSDAATTEIKAERSGTVIWTANYKEEAIINYGANLVQIADEDTCYVIVENENQLLNYGNEVTISYKDREDNTKTATGKVASISAGGVSSAIDTEYSMILLPSDVISDMAVATMNMYGWWNRNQYEVSAVIREMNGVLVVPKTAVTDIAGNTYVYVMDENGKVKAQSFVAGGFNSSYYWVVEGLSEGMNVCLK